MKEKLITFRLPLSVEKEIEMLASQEDTDKSKLMRELIVFGIKKRKLEKAIELYTQGKITLWKAARLSDISLWKIMEIIKEKEIPLQYGEKELRKDLEALKE